MIEFEGFDELFVSLIDAEIMSSGRIQAYEWLHLHVAARAP